MNKPAAFIVVEGGQTWLRTSAETEEAIRTGFIMETVPLYTALPKREPLSYCAIRAIVNQLPTEVDLDTGIEFCRIIEKAHGIGGGDD